MAGCCRKAGRSPGEQTQVIVLFADFKSSNETLRLFRVESASAIEGRVETSRGAGSFCAAVKQVLRFP